MSKQLSLAEDFPVADEAAWMALVEKALRGADFDKALRWRSDDGLQFEPLYTVTDEQKPASYRRRVRNGDDAAPWDIAQLCDHPSPADANRQILDDLQGGTTAVALQVSAPGQPGIDIASPADLAAVLDGVHLDFARIDLIAGSRASEIAGWIQDLWQKSSIAPDRAAAAFNADPLGTLAQTGGLPVALEQAYDELAALMKGCADNWPGTTAAAVDTTPYHNGGASEAQELAALCATLVANLRALEIRGIEPGAALRQTTFVLAVDTDQFLSIAKLRAARALVARIAELSGVADAAPVRLHATTSMRMLSRTDPWVNILRTTMACAAAGVGGADAVTVHPFTWSLGQSDALARRIARNIQIILQEESALGAVADPAAGSWYVEVATTKLANAAWETFQDIERQGGMAQALADGTVQGMISETASQRAGAIATSGAELTGVSAYPEISDKTILVEPHPPAPGLDDPAITVEPVPLRALSEPFDGLRRAADGHFDDTGKRPAVFLACLGSPADFAVRATYARNFFAAGGLDAIQPEEPLSIDSLGDAFDESGARLACICSSDAVYEQEAIDAGEALRRAGAAYIYMAGRPGDARSELRNAGIGTFIHLGCDMLAALKTAHDLVGIR